MKISYYIGLNDKKDKIQKISTIEAYKIIENIALKHFQGFSITESKGMYKHDNGETTIEKSLILMTIDNSINKKFINTVKIALNQESIMVENENVTFKFI